MGTAAECHYRGAMTTQTPTGGPDRPQPPVLTALEHRCLALTAEGRTPAEIVLATDVALLRVAEALKSATEKLDARNITGAITRAARFGLL
ncbi:helix-turn-helix transcriptional regulator [Rhizobium sp. TRM95111]|uniref:helix-turn-helix transcriptional regulator n=1 Tax=Rhizobium alarense TaxID=2846851 RepID=UPI001F2794AA|nr:helix-turn-helix transcriptional regulator [Rhizobium alarense]MCF3638405.1 helix-turn-helix transcriptional regulator [Rhizobium alarense]